MVLCDGPFPIILSVILQLRRVGGMTSILMIESVQSCVPWGRFKMPHHVYACVPCVISHFRVEASRRCRLLHTESFSHVQKLFEVDRSNDQDWPVQCCGKQVGIWMTWRCLRWSIPNPHTVGWPLPNSVLGRPIEPNTDGRDA